MNIDMISTEKYFDELFEYVDLWSAGFVKAYSSNSEGELFTRQKSRVTEALLDRFEVVNKLRKAIGLDEMTVEESYDYYVNNLPEYDERKKVIDLYTYDKKTHELATKEDEFSQKQNAVAFLHVMGAPDFLIENSHVVQDRLDNINRLLVQGGYNKITPQKTEEILTKLLMTQDM